jgi:hypothetical protein
LEKYLKRARPLKMRRSGPVVRPRIDVHNLAIFWGDFKAARADSELTAIFYFALHTALPEG